MSSIDRTTRLADVTFCVLDLETTGTSDEIDEIVEVGAVLVRGGQRLGTFQTMVCHSVVTGPSDRPRIESVLASLLEFTRGAVMVGHNVRFDLRFLNAALWRAGHDETFDPIDAIDTMALARRLLRDDADDCRLGTLAQRFEFETRPTHRAFADAASTVELLHLVIERATHYGAFDLDDLMRLPTLMRHRHRSKLAITARLPRAPGVACLFDRSDQVLHVVASEDLRFGVRRLFDLDDPERTRCGVPAAVLQQLHRVHAVQTHHQLVSRVVSMRWSAGLPPVRRGDAAYLQIGATRSGRLRVVTDRLAPRVVAGPLPRPVARRVVASLASHSATHTAQFVEALTPHFKAADHRPTIDDPLLQQVSEAQHAITFARALHGTFHLDGATTISIDDGRVLDIVIEGRSWAGDLPVVVDGDTAGTPPTVARSLEATFVHRLLADAGVVDALPQPGWEIFET